MRFVAIDISTYKAPTELIPNKQRELMPLLYSAKKQILISRSGDIWKRAQIQYSRGFLLACSCAEKYNHTCTYCVYSDGNDLKRVFVLSHNVDAIAISCVTPTVNKAIALAEKLKQINPKLKIIIGGPHFLSFNFKGLKHLKQNIDIFSISANAWILGEILSGIENNQTIKECYYLENGKFEVGEKIPNSTKDCELPYPDYSLLYKDSILYAHNIRMVNGCPFNCNFCLEAKSYEKNGSEDCERTVTQIIEEILKSIQNDRTTLLHFSDPIFNLKKEKTIELCERLYQLNLPVYFSIDTRLDMLTEEWILYFKKAKIVRIAIGIESFSSKQASCGKSSYESLKKKSTMIRNIYPSLAIQCYLITGLSEKSCINHKEESHYIQKIIREGVIDIALNKIFVPYPDTEQYNNSEKFGMIISEKNWDLYDRFLPPVYNFNSFDKIQIWQQYIDMETIEYRSYVKYLGGKYRLDYYDSNDAIINKYSK